MPGTSLVDIPRRWHDPEQVGSTEGRVPEMQDVRDTLARQTGELNEAIRMLADRLRVISSHGATQPSDPSLKTPPYKIYKTQLAACFIEIMDGLNIARALVDDLRDHLEI